MEDRELLELAAKAAAIEHPGGEHCLNGPALWDCAALRWWRPLTDDGDALRLAVKLGLDLMRTERDVEALAGLPPHVKIDAHQVAAPFAVELIGDEPYAATRRAIVRAAAEIGKGIR